MFRIRFHYTWLTISKRPNKVSSLARKDLELKQLKLKPYDSVYSECIAVLESIFSVASLINPKIATLQLNRDVGVTRSSCRIQALIPLSRRQLEAREGLVYFG